MKAISTALVVATAIFTFSSSHADTVLYGKSTDLGGSSLHSPDYLLGFRITVDKPVDLLAAGIIFRTTGYQANVGLYSSTVNGSPGQLLATTGVFNVSNVGAVETPFSNVIKLTPGHYWFMAQYDENASVGERVGVYSNTDDPNEPDVIAYRYLPFTSSLPSSFGTAILYKRTEMNYYLKTEVVPEPATAAMLLVAFVTLVRGRRN